MSVLEKHVVICSEAIEDIKERREVLDHINKSNGKIFLDISFHEMENFCCNIINLSHPSSSSFTSNESNSIIILSQTAYENFTSENLNELEINYDLCVNNIQMIEKVGGGSCRCMIAEIF